MATLNLENFDESELNVRFSKETLRLYGYLTNFKPKSHGYSKTSFRLQVATFNHGNLDKSELNVTFSKENSTAIRLSNIFQAKMPWLQQGFVQATNGYSKF